MTGWIKTEVAESVPFDNSENGYASTDVQEAIEETQFVGGSSRYGVIFSYNGNVSNKWLQLFQSVPSDASPFVVAESSALISMSVSNNGIATATFTVYINNVATDTITLTAQQTNYKAGMFYHLHPGDHVSTKITSGSASDPVLSVNIKVAA